MSPHDCLVVIRSQDPALRGKRFDLDKDVIKIGRSANNDIVLDGDSISRRHAHLKRRAGTWMSVPRSSQVSRRRLPREVFQLIPSCPLLCDSAPYFTAFVTSS